MCFITYSIDHDAFIGFGPVGIDMKFREYSALFSWSNPDSQISKCQHIRQTLSRSLEVALGFFLLAIWAKGGTVTCPGWEIRLSLTR